MIRLLIIFLMIISCGKKEEEKPTEQIPAIDVLRTKYDEYLVAAVNMRDTETGWILKDDCDAMIWTGKYASSIGVSGVNINAAREEVGKYHRRPINNPCWKDGVDLGAKSTWSRDMAIAGLMPYAFFKGDRKTLEEHAEYCENNGVIKDGTPLCYMGDPRTDDRVIYTPQLISILYQEIFSLGGKDNQKRRIPSLFISGLDDYEAHLQVMSILQIGEASKKIGEADSVPRYDNAILNLSISSKMFDRLSEHNSREPSCALYSAVYHRYLDGNYDSTIDLIVNDKSECSYLRCKEIEKCKLAEKIFVSSLILNWK